MPKEFDFNKAVDTYLEQAQPPQQYSAQEYFSLLLNRGRETRNRKNYGIAAAYILRIGGYELIFLGENNIISENNPHSHAEMDAVQQARVLLNCKTHEEANIAAPKLIESGKFLVRKAPHDQIETLIYTTLEPCPMCTVGSVINTKVSKVVISTPDEYSGQMLEGRLEALAELWPRMAQNQNLQITVCQTEDPNQSESFLPPDLKQLLNRLFFDTKEPLDNMLGNEGFLRYSPVIVTAIAQALIDSGNTNF